MGLAVLLSGCDSDKTQPAGDEAQQVELGPYGPALGVRAPVVRSVEAKTTGEVTGTFAGAKGDDVTGLLGLCNPKNFANFMLTMPGGKDYDEVWVTNMSKGAIGTGATGTFKLDYVEITFRKMTSNDFIQREFRGPGTLTLTTHDAAPEHRHMVGTMEGKGLKGRDDEEGKTLDLEVSFDMDSSCGVTE